MVGNRIQSYDEGKDLFNKLAAVVGKFLEIEMEYLGAIPYDGKLSQAVMKQQPVSLAYPNAPAARAILELAMVLEDEKQEISQMDARNGIAGLFSRIFKSSMKHGNHL